jgi:hypothetical protein
MYQNLGFVAIHNGEFQLAESYARQSLALVLEMHNASQIAATLMGLAGACGAGNKPEKGARLMGAAEALLEANGLVLQPADVLEVEKYQSILREKLGDNVYEEMGLEGRGLNQEEAVALALE